jgi:GNAT superfamily N-acetyltransferase
MIFREAQTADIAQLHEVRMSVQENVLGSPALITVKEYEEFLTTRGKGWLCEIEDKVVGFAIVDLTEYNIWALFIMPEYEGEGIGKKLQNIMLNWYFIRTKEPISLGMIPNTAAEIFYRNNGWREAGKQSNDEIKFKLTFDDWKNHLVS